MKEERPFELEKFGTKLTIFPTGSIYVSAKGDITVLHAEHIIIGQSFNGTILDQRKGVGKA